MKHLTSLFVHKWVGVAIGVYVLGACYNLRQPGANYDEMLYAAPAVNFVTGLENTEPMQINPSVVRLGGRPFPLMVMTYIGGLKVAWHALFFAALGVSVEVARLASVALGILALLWTYGFVRQLLGQAVANVSIVLIGFSTEWAFYTSRDMTIVVMVVCKMAALYYGYRYVKEKRLLLIGLSGLFLGLGLYDKASFLWFIAVIVAYLALFERTRIRSLPIRAWMAGFGAFLTGSIVFFVFNIARFGATFAPVKTHVVSGGMQSLDLAENFLTRGHQLWILMSGEAILELFTGTRYDHGLLRHGTWLGVLLILVIGLVRVWRAKDMRLRKMAWFLCFMTGVSLLLTIYSPTVLSLHHVAAVWPFHWILVAFALNVIASQTARWVLGWIPVVLIALQVTGTALIYRLLDQKGATSNWSETIYELNDYLVQKDQCVVAVSWGFTDNLLVTSSGRVKLVRLYRELIGSDETVQQDLIRRSLGHEQWYLVKLDQRPDYDALFRSVAKREGYDLSMEQEFFEKSGIPIYRIYSIRRDSSQF